MRKAFLLLSLIVLFSCLKKEKTKLDLVKTYYKGFQNSNYNLVEETLADTLTTISGDYTTNFTPKNYYHQFRWDSVFKPEYDLIELKVEENTVISTVSISS